MNRQRQEPCHHYRLDLPMVSNPAHPHLVFYLIRRRHGPALGRLDRVGPVVASTSAWPWPSSCWHSRCPSLVNIYFPSFHSLVFWCCEFEFHVGYFSRRMDGWYSSRARGTQARWPWHPPPPPPLICRRFPSLALRYPQRVKHSQSFPFSTDPPTLRSLVLVCCVDWRTWRYTVG